MDRRKRKTQAIIKEIFLTLLAQKEISKISVSEVIQLADISRGTFYLHYKDIYDLYDRIEDEVFSELMQLFDENLPNQPENVNELMEAIIAYIGEHKSIFQLMFTSEVNKKTSTKLRNFFAEKLMKMEPDRPDHHHLQIESTFIISGIIGVIEDWLMIQDNPQISTAQSEQNLIRSLQSILASF